MATLTRTIKPVDVSNYYESTQNIPFPLNVEFMGHKYDGIECAAVSFYCHPDLLDLVEFMNVKKIRLSHHHELVLVMMFIPMEYLLDEICGDLC